MSESSRNFSTSREERVSRPSPRSLPPGRRSRAHSRCSQRHPRLGVCTAAPPPMPTAGFGSAPIKPDLEISGCDCNSDALSYFRFALFSICVVQPFVSPDVANTSVLCSNVGCITVCSDALACLHPNFVHNKIVFTCFLQLHVSLKHRHRSHRFDSFSCEISTTKISRLLCVPTVLLLRAFVHSHCATVFLKVCMHNNCGHQCSV